MRRAQQPLRRRCVAPGSRPRRRAAACSVRPARPRRAAGATRPAAHPGGRLHTTAKTVPPPEPSGAMGMGVSQFVNEPHTCTCAVTPPHACAAAQLPPAQRGRGARQGSRQAREGQCRPCVTPAHLAAAIRPDEPRRHQLAAAALHCSNAPGALPRSRAPARRPRSQGGVASSAAAARSAARVRAAQLHSNSRRQRQGTARRRRNGGSGGGRRAQVFAALLARSLVSSHARRCATDGCRDRGSVGRATPAAA
jgi:hypothetical protein